MDDKFQLSPQTVLNAFNELSYRILRERDDRFLDYLREQDLTINQYMILHLLRNNGFSSSANLANKLKLTPSSITYIIDALEKRSLVVRIENTEDRRSHHVTLTDQGEQLIFLPERKMDGANEIMDMSQEDLMLVFIAIDILNKKLK